METQQGHRYLLFEGILFVLIGILALISPVIATYGFEIFLGLLFLVLGFALAFRTNKVSNIPGTATSIATSILMILVGLCLLIFPIIGILTMSIILAVGFFIDGIFKLALAFQTRFFTRSGLFVITAIFDFIIAAIVWYQWPISAFWFIGVLVGVNFLLVGFSTIFLSQELKRPAN